MDRRAEIGHDRVDLVHIEIRPLDDDAHRANVLVDLDKCRCNALDIESIQHTGGQITQPWFVRFEHVKNDASDGHGQQFGPLIQGFTDRRRMGR